MKILFFAPHLSTGGSPAYLLWLTNKHKNAGNIIKVIEYCNYSDEYNVHKKKILDVIGVDNFVSLFNYGGECEDWEVNVFLKYVKDFDPDVIHLNELPEIFTIGRSLNTKITDFLYNNPSQRRFKVTETCHTSEFNFQKKKYIPDSFTFCSKYHLKLTDHIKIPKEIVEMVIEPKARPDRETTLLSLGLNPKFLHVLNVGLFNEFKNQKLIFEVADQLRDYNVQFHFIGNLCYLNNCQLGKLQNLFNCKIWGERDDVDKFMSCMNVFIFPSIKELNPISIKEAISWSMKCFINNLPTYAEEYDHHELIEYINSDRLNIINYLKSHSSKSIKFAIYTSFYNSEKYINNIFKNILSQTYVNWTWFITDDFSDDNTESLLRLKAKEDPRIKYVEQSRKKEMYWQPNKFISKDYEYIILVDADDEFHIDALYVYSYFLQKYPESTLLTSDFRKVNYDENNLHSISYAQNSQPLYQQLKQFHPNIDYLNNLNYYAFGALRCFKNIENLKFEINNYDACAEDSYRMMVVSSYGKHLHIPRNLYSWNKRLSSESHNNISNDIFNANFQIGLDLCKKSSFEPYYFFNSCYKELNSLLIFDYKNLPRNISIISPNLTIDQKREISGVYPEKNVVFNSTKGQQLYTVILNYFDDTESLSSVVEELKNNNNIYYINFYYLDENKHITNDSKDNFIKMKTDFFIDIFGKYFNPFSYFLYIRHLNFVANYGISYPLY